MRNHLKSTIQTFLWILLILLPLGLQAHAPDQGYIFLRVYNDGIEGRVEINIKDLNKVQNPNLERGLTVADLQPYYPQLEAYVKERISFASANGNHTMTFTEPTIMVLDELGDFVQFNFKLEDVTTIPDALDVQYGLVFDQDRSHQGLLIVEYNWKAGIFNNESLVSLFFSPNDRSQSLSLTEASVFNGFMAMVKMGVWHIWIGIDHILFILALVLPSVVRRRREEDEIGTPKAVEALGFAATSATHPGAFGKWRWIPVERFKPAFIYMIKIITFFTIAHTITLSLAALQIVELPSRFVESIIALSIALAAYHNIRPILKGKEWLIAFGFGLFHGFGFASVLSEIGLSGEYTTLSLFGFNLGVELGQVAIICLIFPLLYFLRRSKAYPKIMLYGSIFLIAIAIYWFVERSLGIDLPVDDLIYRAIMKVGYMTGIVS